MPDMCAPCKGHGVMDPATDVISCARCGGRGQIVNQMGPFTAQMTCNSCFGKGHLIRPGKACPSCGGNKASNAKRTFDVRIPKGIPNGHAHTISGKGSYNINDKAYNDIRMNFVYIMADGVEAIDPESCRISVRITLEQLLCGFDQVIRPWGKDLRIRSSGYFDPSHFITLAGKGMPRYKKDGKFGDLVMRFEVVYPTGRDLANHTGEFLTAFGLPTTHQSDEVDGDSDLRIS